MIRMICVYMQHLLHQLTYENLFFSSRILRLNIKKRSFDVCHSCSFLQSTNWFEKFWISVFPSRTAASVCSMFDVLIELQTLQLSTLWFPLSFVQCQIQFFLCFPKRFDIFFTHSPPDVITIWHINKLYTNWMWGRSQISNEIESNSIFSVNWLDNCIQ